MLCAGLLRAENRVTVRGAYYREASTRVVQPVVEIRNDLPGGIDLGAHVLVDAITSASVAAGNAMDSIFTEFRSEAGIGMGKTFGPTRIGVAYRYSAESDYWSHGLSLALTRKLWQDTGTLSVSLGRGWDQVGSRFRTPACIPTDKQGQPRGTTCPLGIYFGGIAYSQVLSPTLLAQASYELSYSDGFQANLYRSVPNLGYEDVPGKRLRHALAARVAKYLTAIRMGVQLHYRYYRDQYPGFRDDGFKDDPWDLNGHMVEGRIYRGLTSDLEIRLAYRYYRQGSVSFWCDWIASPGCYGPGTRVYTSDPKLGPLRTSFPEAKLFWTAHRLRGVPVLGWLSDGTFEISYGYLFQSTSFGNAHLLQTAYSLPY